MQIVHRLFSRIFSSCWLSAPLITALGGLAGACFAETGIWPVQVVCVALLYAQIRLGKTGPAAWRRTTAHAMLWAVGMFVIGMWWLPTEVTREWPQNPSAPLFIFLVIMGLLQGLAGTTYVAIGTGAKRIGLSAWWSQPLAFALAWVATEGLRANILNLPMLSLGFGQIDAPFAGYAPILGVHGVSLMCVLCAGLAVEASLDGLGRPVTLASRRAHRAWLMPSALLAILLLSGSFLLRVRWTRPAAASVRVVAMQDGLNRLSKYTDIGLNTSLQRTLVWAAQNPGSLIIGSETQILASSRASAQVALARDGVTALIGVRLPDRHQAGRWNNSVVALGEDAHGYRYDKWHLIPFGEYVPPGALAMWIAKISGFASSAKQVPGSADQAPFQLHGTEVVPTICFENFFPGHVASMRAPKRPSIIVNLADMALFNGTWAMPQDVAVNRMLALEFQTPLIRGSDSGTTMFIDSMGRVVARAPRGKPAAIAADITPSEGTTPYAWLLRNIV